MKYTPPTAAETTLAELQDLDNGKAYVYLARIEQIRELLIRQNEDFEVDSAHLIGYIETLTDLKDDIENLSGLQIRYDIRPNNAKADEN